MYNIIYEVLTNPLTNPLTWGAVIGIGIYNIMYSRKKNLSLVQSLLRTLLFIVCAFLGILVGTYITP